MDSKKRIVIIRSNPVNPDSRVEKEAMTFVGGGYSVHILCWDREANHSPKCDKLHVSDMEIPITRLGFKASYGEGFKNIKSYLKFQFAIRKWLKNHRDEYDIVHACDFDTAFFSNKLVLRLKKRFVFDIFDFLYGDPKTFFQRIIKKSQLNIINRAHLTIICTDDRVRQIAGSNPKRLVVVHNSPSSRQLSLNADTHRNKTERIKVCYVGILQDGRLLREIGHYFSKHKEVELHIGGFGYLEKYFTDLSSQNENIKFYGKLPYAQTLELENSCDIMLAIYDPAVENHRFAAPNKFYESLFLGKPVIMVKGTGMSDVVESNGIGAVIDFSESGFSEGIKTLLSSRKEWEGLSKRMKELYKNEYSWDIMEERLLSAYSALNQ